jgi:hypothetical protein
VDGKALGDGWDRQAAEAQYSVHPGIAWVDGLLRPDALEELRRFCLESTIWSDINHSYEEGGIRHGYLGTYVDEGFCCPLLFQIAEELSRAMPAIFKGQPLTRLWAYKYEPYSQGIDLHGDNAAVTVNFWITPDNANLSPDSGGMLVYPVEVPVDMDSKKLNRPPPGFLDKTGVAPIIIPYRQNRAVIFNSELFHATAPLNFKPGYENRRINVTMLYGAGIHQLPSIQSA